jgi:AraC-like DNA-binding protein
MHGLKDVGRSGEPPFVSTEVVDARRFVLELAPWRGRGLRVACGGWEGCAPGYAVRRAGFPYWCIEFVARGRGWLTLAGSEHELGVGSVFAYGPGIAHAIRNDPVRPMTKAFVDFTGADARRRLARAGWAPGTCGRTADVRGVGEAFDAMVGEGRSGGRHAAAACALLLEWLLLKLDASRGVKPGRESRAYDTYRRCVGVLEREHETLESGVGLAARCHVEAAYLCRLFARFGGESPYRALVRRRMHRAAELLMQPGVLVKAAAAQLGEDDPALFSRRFKRVHGVPPEAFARRTG